MKNIKYLWLLAIALGLTACNDAEDFEELLNLPEEETTDLPTLTNGSADFSKFVSLGASFTSGFTDGGLFKAGQEMSFPNTMSKQFAEIGGGTFTQPLMDDNTGAILVGGTLATDYRLVFDGSGPARLDDFLSSQGAPTPTVTTEAGINIGSNFNNFGIPGAKSFHLVTPGYAAFNPFYARIASAPTATVLADAAAQNATFFTLSEIGGNDVLSYATSGGIGIDQTGNINPATYGNDDITDPNVFASALNTMITTLTANGAKGAVGNVPDITSLSFFTTVSPNSLDPSNPVLAPQIETLNAQLYGPLDDIFTALGEPDRMNPLSSTTANPVLINDEDATDRSAEISAALTPLLGAPTAGAFGAIFGRARQATADDLILLTAASAIAQPVTGAPAPVNVNGVSYPLADNFVLTPEEQIAISTATAAYNSTISNIVSSNTNLALVDLNSILNQAATVGYDFDSYNLNTSLVTGGLVSLDGIHLTARGYALMANSFLDAIDTTFGSNFRASGNVANADDFGVTYSPLLP